jgi:hypothetical protein
MSGVSSTILLFLCALIGFLGYRVQKLERAVKKLQVEKQGEDCTLELEEGKDVR